MSGFSEVNFFLFFMGRGRLNLDCHEVVIRAHGYGEVSVVSMLASVPGFIVSHLSILLWAMFCCCHREAVCQNEWIQPALRSLAIL